MDSKPIPELLNVLLNTFSFRCNQLHVYSRTTSFASLSVRSPRKTGRRSWLSNVHSVNLTRAISTGLTHWECFMTAGVIPRPHLPRLFSGKFIKGQVACLSFCSSESILGRFEKITRLLQAFARKTGRGKAMDPPMVFVKLPKSVLGVFHLLWSNEVAIFLRLGVGSRVS